MSSAGPAGRSVRRARALRQRALRSLALIAALLAASLGGGCAAPMLIQHPHAGEDEHDGRRLTLRYGRVPVSGDPEAVAPPGTVVDQGEAAAVTELLRFRVPLRAWNDTGEPWHIRRSGFVFGAEDGGAHPRAWIDGPERGTAGETSDVLVVVQPQGSASFDLLVRVARTEGDDDPRDTYRLVFRDGDGVVMDRLFTVRRFTEASQLLRFLALATGLVVLAGL